jgi:NAD-dependent deacetylase
MNTPVPTSTRPRLFILSGAGLSAESGISTFRTDGGIWSKDSIEKVCNLDTWLENRPAVFEFYNRRLEEMGSAQPNGAHMRLAQWQHRWGAERVKLLTQNVDDLLEKAGAPEVIHLHGDIHHYLCTACDHRFERTGAGWDEHLSCPQCSDPAAVKPGVVFFNESAPMYSHLGVMRATMTEEDVFLAIGTSFIVIAPPQILPRARWNAHPRSILVDPRPSEDTFGVVCAKPASVGLAVLEPLIASMMDGTSLRSTEPEVSRPLPRFIERLKAALHGFRTA